MAVSEFAVANVTVVVFVAFVVNFAAVFFIIFL